MNVKFAVSQSREHSVYPERIFFTMCRRKRYRTTVKDISTHLSFGSQLNKTVRSLLSRKSFHGMSSSSGLRLMDFMLSSKLEDLYIRLNTIRSNM